MRACCWRRCQGWEERRAAAPWTPLPPRSQASQQRPAILRKVDNEVVAALQKGNGRTHPVQDVHLLDACTLPQTSNMLTCNACVCAADTWRLSLAMPMFRDQPPEAQAPLAAVAEWLAANLVDDSSLPGLESADCVASTSCWNTTCTVVLTLACTTQRAVVAVLTLQLNTMQSQWSVAPRTRRGARWTACHWLVRLSRVSIVEGISC